MTIYPVIMAGGVGSRLWPLSRQLNPKQFLPLVDSNHSMLQATIQRLDGLDVAMPLLLCNEDHRFLAAEQLRMLGKESSTIILEPMGRNTAPAVALAALALLEQAGDGLMLVLAADHLISDTPAFHRQIEAARKLATEGRLVTFGVVPTRAEVGYGYIEQGDPIADSEGFKVNRFVEKPDSQTAEQYIVGGNYLWNSGMFMFRAQTYLDELERLRPDILSACRASFASSKADMHFVRVGRDAFEACPAESIDYAVMEHTDSAAVVPLDAGWSDIGSWSALWDVGLKDDEGNVIHADVMAVDSHNNYIYAGSRMVATVGVQDLVIVETADAVLVAHKDCVQDVKRVVELMQQDGRQEHETHREVYRPWGVYDTVEVGDRYQVKRITVKPGAKLSVQMHHHRAEHWVVVSGTAKVTSGDKTYLVTENQSTYIPIGQVHSLENPGVIPLHLIEVQSGSYLGEDDIVRFEDKYGRA